MHSPTLHVPIGPSGSGKSTLFRKLKEENPQLLEFSLDALRHEWYDPNDYRKAWKASVDDPSFKTRAQDSFLFLLDQQKDIFVDNTNLSTKVRRFYLQQAKAKGYKTVAYVFNVPAEILIARQFTRGDKYVPENVIRDQIRALKRPLDGEFDQVIEV